MSRGDAVFARVDLSLQLDVRWRKLNASGKVMYITCYLAAVEVRSSTLPYMFDAESLSDRCGLDKRTGRTALQKCCAVELLTMTHEGRVYVPGVREKHIRLQGWRADPDQEKATHTGMDGADNGPSTEQNRTEQREGVPEEFIKSHPEYLRLINSDGFEDVRPEQYAATIQSFPDVDEKEGVDLAILEEVQLMGQPKEPARFLQYRFSEIDKRQRRGPGRAGSGAGGKVVDGKRMIAMDGGA